MPDVTVTALAAQITREHPNRLKGFVETEIEAHILLNLDLDSHTDFICSF